jgi:hypothetical protein
MICKVFASWRAFFSLIATPPERGKLSLKRVSKKAASKTNKTSVVVFVYRSCGGDDLIFE